jgi:hypothetical protein
LIGQLFVSNNERGTLKWDDFKALMDMGYELTVGTGKTPDDEDEEVIKGFVDSAASLTG